MCSWRLRCAFMNLKCSYRWDFREALFQAQFFHGASRTEGTSASPFLPMPEYVTHCTLAGSLEPCAQLLRQQITVHSEGFLSVTQQGDDLICPETAAVSGTPCERNCCGYCFLSCRDQLLSHPNTQKHRNSPAQPQHLESHSEETAADILECQ